jgi:hypothetical protein
MNLPIERQPAITIVPSPERQQPAGSSALERTKKLYEATYKGRFTIDSTGIRLADPMLPLPDFTHFSHHSEAQEHIEANLPHEARAFLFFTGNNELKSKATTAISWVYQLAEGVEHNMESWGRHLAKAKLNPKVVAEAAMDEVSFTFAHTLAGDPIEHITKLEIEGFPTEQVHTKRVLRRDIVETKPRVEYELSLTRDALRFVAKGDKPIKKVTSWERVVSIIPRWDALLDIKRVEAGFRHAMQGRPTDELFVYGTAFIIDLLPVSSPAIDAPSVAPFVKLGLKAKEMLFAELFSEIATHPDESINLYEGCERLTTELLAKKKGLVQSAEKAVKRLTLKAAYIKKLEKGQALPEPTDEQIANSAALTQQEKDRLIMGRQILGAIKKITGQNIQQEVVSPSELDLANNEIRSSNIVTEEVSS